MTQYTHHSKEGVAIEDYVRGMLPSVGVPPRLTHRADRHHLTVIHIQRGGVVII